MFQPLLKRTRGRGWKTSIRIWLGHYVWKPRIPVLAVGPDPGKTGCVIAMRRQKSGKSASPSLDFRWMTWAMRTSKMVKSRTMSSLSNPHFPKVKISQFFFEICSARRLILIHVMQLGHGQFRYFFIAQVFTRRLGVIWITKNALLAVCFADFFEALQFLSRNKKSSSVVLQIDFFKFSSDYPENKRFL